MSILDEASDNANKTVVIAAKHGQEFPPRIGTLYCKPQSQTNKLLKLPDAVPCAVCKQLIIKTSSKRGQARPRLPQLVQELYFCQDLADANRGYN